MFEGHSDHVTWKNPACLAPELCSLQHQLLPSGLWEARGPYLALVRRSQGCFLGEIVPGLCFERAGMGWLEEERFQRGGICAKAWRVQACLLFRAMLCCSGWFLSGIFIPTSSRPLPLSCFLFHSILFPYMALPCPWYKLPSFCQ